MREGGHVPNRQLFVWLEFAFQIPKILVNSEPYNPFYQKKRSFGSDRVMR